MEGPMKNIPKGEPVDLRDLVPYQEGQGGQPHPGPERTRQRHHLRL